MIRISVHHRRWTNLSIPRAYAFGITALLLLLLSIWGKSAPVESQPALRGASPRQPVGELTRFAVIGDYGIQTRDAERVADLVKSWGPDFIVTVGDNNYEKGRAEDIDDNIGTHYRAYIYPYLGSLGGQNSGELPLINRFFPALGNHDWDSMHCTADGCVGPYLDYFTLPGNERYYTFEQGHVRIFVLDSDPHEPDGITALSNQAMWLRAELAASTATWNLIVMHHAPYSSGSRHGSHTEMQWPFAQWGADAVLAGHDHTYERLELGGIPYFVNGLGGKSRHTFREPIKGSQFTYDSDFGAMQVEADATQLTFQFLVPRSDVIDSHTLYADAAPSEPDLTSAEQVNVRVISPEDNLIEQTSTGHISYPLGELVTDKERRSYITGGRFQNVQIPPCATILGAHMEFVAADSSGKNPAALHIYGEKGANAEPFDMTPFDISNRQQTQNYAEWNITRRWDTVGESHWTPDLAAIVQEIVQQPGWTSGNTLALFLRGSGDRSVVSYTMQPLAAPRLVITYEVPKPKQAPQLERTIPETHTHFIFLPLAAAQYCP